MKVKKTNKDSVINYKEWCSLRFLICCLVSFVLSSDIDLKEAQRFFAQKFSCGASVTAEDEIIIQGDFTDDIIEVIQEKWPEVMINHVLNAFSQENQLYPALALSSDVQ